MSRSHAGRVFTILILAATIAVSSAWGASPGRAQAGPPDLFDRLWGAFTAIWAEVGCILDPHGGCTTGSSTDVGCIIDPNGGCAAGQSEPPAPPPTTDVGCIADPHGGCAPGS